MMYVLYWSTALFTPKSLPNVDSMPLMVNQELIKTRKDVFLSSSPLCPILTGQTCPIVLVSADDNDPLSFVAVYTLPTCAGLALTTDIPSTQTITVLMFSVSDVILLIRR